MFNPLLHIVVLCVITSTFYSQKVLNGSFEGEPINNADIDYWVRCSYMYNNSPDLFPFPDWGVTLPASGGKTYLDLVLKEGGTSFIDPPVAEQIFGFIDPPLLPNNCCRISIDLAVSDQFIIDFWGDLYDFTSPAKLKVCFGRNPCDTSQVLWEFNDLQNSEWITYTKIYKSNDTLGGIALMSGFKTLPDYYGHVLIDNIQIFKSGDTIVDSTIIAHVGDNMALYMDNIIEDGVFSWANVDANCLDCQSINFEVTEDVVVDVAWTDSSGCFNEHTIYRIYILPEIPNVFTPNGDSQNDLFNIKGLRENSSLYIYNRWGSLVYKSNNYHNDWNGENLSEGVYYYFYKTILEEQGYEYNGTVSLFR